jgi:hypothetical protein
MALLSQVEIRAGCTHTVVWVEASLKPTVGMTLVCKNDPRTWEVVHAYKTVLDKKGIASDWKVGGLKRSPSM